MDIAQTGWPEPIVVQACGCERVAVTWEQEPEEWLWPVVYALKESALVCCPPPSEYGTAQTILRVSVTHVGHSRCTMDSVKTPQLARTMTSIPSDSADSYLHLVAEEATLRFSSRPLLSTRWGLALQHRGWLSRSCAFVLLIYVSLILSPFAAYSVIIPAARSVVDGCLQETVRMKVTVTYIWNSFSILILQCVFFVLTFQRFNRAMFLKAMWSFECFWLVGNLFLLDFSHVLEVLLVAAPAWNLSQMQIAAQMFYALTSPVWGVWLGTIDAWMISRRSKAIIMSIVVLTTAYILFRLVYVRQWSSTTYCHWNHCTTAKNIAVSAAGNLFVFCGKLWWTYISGRPFATLRAHYRLPCNPRTSHQESDVPMSRRLLSSCCFRVSCFGRGRSTAEHSVAQTRSETLTCVFGHVGVQTTLSLRSESAQEVEGSGPRAPTADLPMMSVMAL